MDEGLSAVEQAALDRLELELRKLPDVLAVGFEGPAEGSAITEDAVVSVHVFVADGAVRATVEQQALDLSRLHVDRPLRIVIAPEAEDAAPGATGTAALASANHRVRLIGVAFSADGSSVEVTLAHNDANVVCAGPAASLAGSADATLGALRDLGWSVPFGVSSCVRLSVGSTGAVLVHLVGTGGERLGVSAGSPPQLGAARATLHALNRWLDDPARRPATRRQPEPRP